MARTFAKMYLSVWNVGSDFYELSADAQWLYWTLLGHPLLSPAGVLPVQPRKWAKRSKGMTERRVQAALRELVDTGQKVMVDDDTEELLIRTFIAWDKGYKTPNIHTSITTSIQSIESHDLRVAATNALTQALHDDPPGKPKGGGRDGR